MAAEQLAGQDVTVRSDIYALGQVLHELFTGRRAPDSSSLDVSPPLQQAILQCLAQEPSQRPVSAQAVSGMLKTVLFNAVTRWRQLALFALATIGLMVSVGELKSVVQQGSFDVGSALRMAAGFAAIAIALKFPVGWTVVHKGHRIRLEKDPFRGERLFIDGRLADRHQPTVRGTNTLRGTIESGKGAGERITATTHGHLIVACRIVAESFTPGGSQL